MTKSKVEPKLKGNLVQQKQAKSPQSLQKEKKMGYSKKYFLPVILFILCFLLYGNTLQNEYAGDDYIYTTHNDFILKGFSAFKDIFDKGSLYGVAKEAGNPQYRPLTLLNFMTEVSIFGLNPHVGHFFNVLFFAFTVVLLYFFLQKILKGYTQTIILAATLLFAFHPIHTEVVADIKSRDEILSFLFGLLSFYFIMLQQEQKWEGRFMNRPYIFSLLAFSVAIFCKETALTFVAIIPMLLYFFTSMELKKIVINTLPYAAMICIYLLIRSHVLQALTFSSKILVMQNSLMATDNIADRTATSFVFLGKYIYMTFVPYPLSWDYSYNQIPIVSWTNIKAILSVLVFAGLIGYAVWGAKRKSLFSFLIALFFITLFLSSNLIIKIGATFGERFLYVPSLAFCIALPVLVSKGLNKLEGKKGKPEVKNHFQFSTFIFRLSIACLLIIYTVIVIPRNAEWKNDYTLYSSGVITSPDDGKTHEKLGIVYQDTAQSAILPAKRTLYYTLATKEFIKATKISTMDPDCFYSLAMCYDNEGKIDSAVIEYKKTLEIEPEYSAVLNNLGVIYLNRKQYDTALQYFLRSQQYAPNILALRNIINCYQTAGNLNAALHYDSLMLNAAPDYRQVTLANMAKTYNNIGLQYLRMNELDKALQGFSIALSIDSNLVVAIKNIGLVYEQRGNNEMAEKYAQKAKEKEKNMAY